jgi:hypothetical protein
VLLTLPIINAEFTGLLLRLHNLFFGNTLRHELACWHHDVIQHHSSSLLFSREFPQLIVTRLVLNESSQGDFSPARLAQNVCRLQVLARVSVLPDIDRALITRMSQHIRRFSNAPRAVVSPGTV